MKICIIGFSTIELSPYLEKYIRLIKKTKNTYFYIERKLENNSGKVAKYENSYMITCKKRKTFFLKIIEHLKWKSNVKKILKREKPERIIVLTQYPAFLLKSVLLHKYRFNYYFDIRDYNSIFSKRFLKKMIDNSIYTFISSDGFKKWLPDSNKIIVNHNLPQESNEMGARCIDYTGEVSIAYFGAFSYLEENLELIKKTGNNSKYKIIYAGFGEIEKDLKNFCKKNMFDNIIFLGKFKREDKEKMYSNICFINAIYGSKSMLTTTALPNKFYDSLTYRIPIIASEHTYLGDIVKKERIGFTVDSDFKNFEKNMEEFIDKYDYYLFNQICESLLKKYCFEEEKMNELFLSSVLEIL